MTDKTDHAVLAFSETVDAIAAGEADGATLDANATEDFVAHLSGQADLDRDRFKASSARSPPATSRPRLRSGEARRAPTATGL